MLTGTLASGVSYAFTDRHGGVSPPPYDTLNLSPGSGDAPDNVNENRARLAAGLGVEHVVFMRQLHGATIVVADGPWLADPPEADGVVSGMSGLGLGVLAADCAPVLLADPIARVVAAVHVGRAGLVAGTVDAAIATLVAHGGEPARIAAVIGPAVCGSCYEVPAALQTEVAAQVPAVRAQTRRGTPSLDVAAGVTAQLAKAGVPNVTRIGRCTVESPDLYSYRRDGVTGRFAGIVWLSS